MLRVAELDHVRIEQTLAILEELLDQGDLQLVYARLRAEPKSRAAS